MSIRGATSAALLCSVLIAGCVTQPAQIDRAEAEKAWSAHRQRVSAIRGFVLQARIGGSALGARGDVNWRQDPNGNFSIRVTGPFGAGGMSLRGTPARVEITTEDGVFVTEQPESWLQEHMGWSLPIEHLRWWALGLPAPTSPSQLEIDGAGHVAELRQDGWRLSYDSYQPVGSHDLPKRFDATNDRASLKVLADQWTLDPAP